MNYLRNGRKEVLAALMKRSEREHQPDREWIEKRRKYSFNDLLVEKPWDKLNMERLGKSNAQILVYHDSWLDLLTKSSQHAKDAYTNSRYQKDLEVFINEKLSKHVYKRKQK